MSIDPSSLSFRTIYSRGEEISDESSDSPIPSIVERCLIQYAENRSGTDPTKERMGTRLFKAYSHLSSSDRIAIKERLEKIRDQALNKKERLKKKRPQVENKALEEYGTKPVKQTKLLKKATRKYEAAVWALKNLETGGRRTRKKSDPELISVIENGADPVSFGKDPFNGLKPKAFAMAFIAQDLKCMQQANGLSDIAPTQEKALGKLLTRNYNRLSNFTSASVLLAPDVATATKRVKYFIKVMQELEKFETSNERKGDHISFLAVGGALNGPSISRLTAIQEGLSKSERKYLYGDEGGYKKLSRQYLSVPKALKLMPTAALFSPAILSTFLEGASANKLEDRIDIVSATAQEFGRILKDARRALSPKGQATLSIPKLPPEGFEFPDDFLGTDNDQEDYLYYLSKQLQQKV